MATARLKFRKDSLLAIEPPASAPGSHTRDTYHDTASRYLKLRVADSGSKVFYFCRKVSGRVRWIKLDAFPAMSVFVARNECERLAGEFAKGNDPARPTTDRLTFDQLFGVYLDGHAKPHKRTWQEDERKYNTMLSHWGSRSVHDIDRSAVNALHKRLGRDRGQYLANRTLALVRKVFNYGIDVCGLALPNPCHGIQAFRETSRDRFLNADGLRRFFDALASEPAPDWRDFFELTLWTGARRANVQAMAWRDVDLEAALWTIPAKQFKNGEPFRAVLAEPALAILAKRKNTSRGEGSPFVFPAHSKTGHIVEPRKAWSKLLKRAGLEGLRLHDLRRTLGSWQAATGSSLQVIGKTLGHKDTATTAIYSRLNLDPVRASVGVATEAMLAASRKESPNGKENRGVQVSG